MASEGRGLEDMQHLERTERMMVRCRSVCVV